MLYYDVPPLMSTLLLLLLVPSVSAHISLAHNLDLTLTKGRSLMGFNDTSVGGYATLDCAPSGPCIPCSRPEKTDAKYRCGETAYRIRLKCVVTRHGLKDAESSNKEKERSTLEFTDIGSNQQDGDPTISITKLRRLLGDASKSQGGLRGYILYRSCIPAVSEEKLSVLGFEGLMLALLISSGSFIYIRRKRSSVVAGGAPVRPVTVSRF